MGVSELDDVMSIVEESVEYSEVVQTELSEYTDEVALSIKLLVSMLEVITSIIELVVFTSGTSVVETGMLVDVSEAIVVEELMRELDECLGHFALTSESFGAVPFCAGKVNVHSLSSLMFLTPRRDKRR